MPSRIEISSEIVKKYGLDDTFCKLRGKNAS